VRFGIKDLERKFQKSEDDIKALQSVGQIIGEVLKQIDDEKCKIYFFYGFSPFFLFQLLSNPVMVLATL
jgi:hypothetical protein